MLKIKTKLNTEDTKPATRASISSPYFDLDSSVKVADVLYNKGGGSCTTDQLAAWLGYSSTRSGTYLTRVSAANKHFGLIDQSGDVFNVTERAKKILSPVMPEDAINAKAEAFLSVPLFGKVYDQFRGSQLPPKVGLKNLFQNTYKILPDQLDKSIRIFFNSAEQAGFFLTTGDQSRLVRPNAPNSNTAALSSSDIKKDDLPAPTEKLKAGGGGGDGPRGIHEAISGLLRDLPAPGTYWPAPKKKRFLDAFKATIDHIYPEEDSP